MGNRMPHTDRNSVLTLRVSAEEKEQLAEMAKKGWYGSTSSEVVRNLIKRAHLGR